MLSNKNGLGAVGLSAIAAIASIALPSAIAQSNVSMTAKQAVLMGKPASTAQPAPEEIVGTLIVKMRTPLSDLAQAQGGMAMRSLPAMAGVGIKSVRPMSEDTALVALDTPMKLSQAKAVAARLASDPSVEYAEPDTVMKPFAVPTDADFISKQWNLYPPTTDYVGAVTVPVNDPPVNKTAPPVGGANLIAAWDRTKGEASVVVAIVDTGIVNHPDLNNAGLANLATYMPGGRFLPGYDFVSSDALTLPANFVANDGNGRDNDPRDPGDAVNTADRANPLCNDNTPNQGTAAAPSTWHGTHSAGVVAATADMAGVAGIGWNVRVVPVRALGRCGGSMLDVADAIRWAAAVPVTTLPLPPTNANRAQVILVGAGGKAGVPCGPTLQGAVDAAIAAGSVVVAAAGNEGAFELSAPANCTGVIAVTAHTINGETTQYGNLGPAGGAGIQPTISAAGGGSPGGIGAGGVTDDPLWDGYYIWSTIAGNGNTPAALPLYGRRIGTSAAAAQVAGVAALIKSLRPEATPAQIKSAISTSARPFPELGSCAPGRAFGGQCGAGLLDATRALQAAGPPVVVTQPQSLTVPVGQTAAFTVDAIGVVSYQWTRAGVNIAVDATTSTYTTPALAATDNNVAYAVVMTNSFGPTTSAAATVTVNSGPPPAANAPSSGGGALPLWQLLLLSALLLASRVRIGYREH